VQTLLTRCENIKILATSREPLGLNGEKVFSVPPLSVAFAFDPEEWHSIGNADAVRLFLARAQDVLPTFALTSSNAIHIANLCRRLDGIPLGIELAAARVNILKVEELATRLESGFELLTDKKRSVLPRHQSLRAMIDWSHSLLSDAEQILFRRL